MRGPVKAKFRPLSLAKRLQHKELMRRLALTSSALIILAACRRDGVDSAVPSCPAGGALVAPFTAVTVGRARLGTCRSLPGNGATYLVVGQFGSVGEASNVVNWEIGTAVAVATAAPAS